MNRAHLAVVAVAVAVAGAAEAAERGYLLRDSFLAPPAGAVSEVRGRVVAAELALLDVAGLKEGERRVEERELILRLFDDAFLPVRLSAVERDRTGSTIWNGRVDGDLGSSVILTVHGGVMSGLVEAGGRRFEIRPGVAGLSNVVEVDTASFPSDDDSPLTVPRPDVATDAITEGGDSADTIDVLVAHTAPLREIYPTSDAMGAFISTAVASVNAAYANSQVNPRLRLVGTMEVDYDDRTDTFANALRRITTAGDGYMDDVHARREQLKADAVALIVRNPTNSLCGTAWIMGPVPTASFQTHAYSVTRWDCAASNYSLAHELGHNFGLQHDRANAGSSTPSYPWAYGYQDPENRFRDIMAYQCAVACPRVGYFSNPQLLYNGAPLGIGYLETNGADTARALNMNAAVIANWRKSAADVAPLPRRRPVRY